MTDYKNQSNFINQTIDKVHDIVAKFMLETDGDHYYKNYKASTFLYLLEEYKSNLLKQKKAEKNQIKNNDGRNLYLLPMINNINNPNILIPNSSLFSQKTTNKNILKGFQDINKIKEKDNKANYRHKIKSLNINTNDNLYFDKYYKYNNDIKNRKFFHHKLYDKYDNTIIRNRDISLGIYDMNVKKLIPKGADVTLTMNMWGNPMIITGKEVKNTYKKSSRKDEVAPGDLNKLKPNKYTLQEFYKTQPIFKDYKKNQNMTTNSFMNKKLYPNKNIDKKNMFLTESSSFLNKKKSFNNLEIKYDNLEDNNNDLETKTNNFNDIINDNKYNSTYYYSNQNSQDFSHNFDSQNFYTFYKSKEQNKFYNYIKNLNMKNNYLIKYYYFQLVIDEEFNLFKQKNKEKWKKINNILANFNILFEKLNINKACIDSNKILKLIEFYNGKTKNITNKDLLMCLTKSDLKEKGFDPDNEYILYGKIKEAFIIRIQKFYRKRLAIKKYKDMKFLYNSLIKIQKNFKGYLIRKKIKYEIEDDRVLCHKKYNELFKKFQNDYDEILSGERIEIHINSLSYDGKYNNCITDKYSMKENLQISRLIRLIDPKLKIIYIIPYNLPEEILSYYYSILENIGIKNLEKRVHFIVPESTEFLPLHYSLSKLLFFSHRTITEIKTLVFNKKSFIIPGLIGDIEEKLSLALDIPMLMSPKSKIDLIFNKSGIKNFLEINEIPFPISAWNIITEEEFYSSLAHLIATYPDIKIWIFKTNLDTCAKGIAYLNTNKIEAINLLRKEKKTNRNFTVDMLQEKLFAQLKNILIKNAAFAYPNLYKNWKEYLKNFLLNKGIIECCPTNELEGIMGRPCIPLLIEPNGKIKILPSFEKINVHYFKNVICTSPQKCIENNEMVKLADKIGNFLFSQGIVGCITIDCITFHNTKKILYWCLDMKYGYTQTICDIQYCYFLYAQSILHKDVISKYNEEIKSNIYNIDYISDSFNTNNKKENENNNSNNNIKNNNEDIHNYLTNDSKAYGLLSDSMIFSLPYISSEFIKEIKLKELIRIFRYNNIVFNVENREGIIFNFCDGLECGIFGLCGVINLEDIENISPELKLWKLVNISIDLLKKMIFKIKKDNGINSNFDFNKNLERNDKIDLQDIINKIKKILKEKEIEQEKEENRKKKLANSPFV